MEFELDGLTARLITSDATEQFPMQSIRFKFENWMQIVSVYDISGDLIFAIDYLGLDIDQLQQVVKQSER
jgi:hypothetical protein